MVKDNVAHIPSCAAFVLFPQKPLTHQTDLCAFVLFSFGYAFEAARYALYPIPVYLLQK
jgi:hypothetical protein